MLPKRSTKPAFPWINGSRAIAMILVFVLCSFSSPKTDVFGWGPAANAQEDEDETEEPVKKTKVKKKARNAIKKSAKKPAKRPKKSSVKRAKPQANDDEEAAEDESGEEENPDSVINEEQDPIKISSNARELAVRVVGLGKISVSSAARRYVPKELESRLAERLNQDIAAKTYFEPQTIEGAFDLRSSAATLAAANRKSKTDGLLVFQIGLEKIQGYLASASGRRIREFDFKYRIGELEEKNAVSVLTERIIEGVVASVPFRGFITAVTATGKGTVNLGSHHGVKEGDILELFEFRRPTYNSTQKRLLNVEVKKVIGPSESQVEVVGSRARIDPFAKVSFSLAKSTVVEATDHSVVSGRWWFGFGGELNSFSAEAAAPQYESRVFKINGAPFGYASGGNDVWTFRGAFGSGRSDVETLRFIDFQTTYALYQTGGAQAAWTLAGGVRAFAISVVPNPGILSALESTTLVTPMAELKYQFVPRGRVRLVGSLEVFWPIYTSGAQTSALVFAFGAGAGGGMQISVTSKFGLEVFGKLRYLRRPIEGQNGVQERQQLLGAGLIFSF